MKAIAIPQHYRNQLSLLSWVFAAICAGLLFLAAAASANSSHADTRATNTVVVSAQTK